MKKNKVKIILPYIIVISTIFLTVFISILFATNLNEEKRYGKNIEKVTVINPLYNKDSTGFYETTVNDKYYYLGYYNILESNDSVARVNEDSYLILPTETKYLWKIKLYVDNDVSKEDIIYKYQDFTHDYNVKEGYDEEGKYLLFEINKFYNYFPSYLSFTKELNINKIVIYFDSIINELGGYEFKLNSDNKSYELSVITGFKLDQNVAIVPDTYKGLPVTSYNTTCLRTFYYVKLGANISKIFSNSFNQNLHKLIISCDSNLKDIEKNAFVNPNIDTLYIPKTIENLNNEFCKPYKNSLVKLIFEEENLFSSSDFSCYYNVKKDNLIYKDGMTFIIKNNEAILIDIDNYLKEINIPNKVASIYDVTTIEDNVLYGLTDVTSIILPDSLITIKNMFKDINYANVDGLLNEYNKCKYIGTCSNPYAYLVYAPSNQKVLLHDDIQFINGDVLNKISLNHQLIENNICYVGSNLNPYLCCIGIGVNGSKLTYQISSDTEYILDLECKNNAQINLPYNLKKIFNGNTTSNISLKIADSNSFYKTYHGSLYEKVDEGYTLLKASTNSIIDGKFLFLDDCVCISNIAFYAIEIEKLELPNRLKFIDEKAFYGITPSLIVINEALIKAGNLFSIIDEQKTKIMLNDNNEYYVLKNDMILSKDETILFKEFSTDITFTVPNYIKVIKSNAVSARNIFISDNVLVIENNFCKRRALYEPVFIFFKGTENEGYGINWKSDVTGYYNNNFFISNNIVYEINDNSLHIVSYITNNKTIDLVSTVNYKNTTYIVKSIKEYALSKALVSKDLVIPDTIELIEIYGLMNVSTSNFVNQLNIYISSSTKIIQNSAFMFSLSNYESIDVYLDYEAYPDSYHQTAFYLVSNSSNEYYKFTIHYKDN